MIPHHTPNAPQALICRTVGWVPLLLRTTLLILAITAMGGTWLLEQPSTSQVDWHPRVRLLWRLVPQVWVWKSTVDTSTYL